MNKWQKIWQALGRLKADKEDTAQVFIILSLLGEKAGARSFKKFMKNEKAAAMLERERDLMSYLCDREYLAALPAGSLGRHYFEFTEREQISADGLAEASEAGAERYNYEGANGEQRSKFHQRQRDAHDLWHVVSGYGRDGLGELALLAVTWRQMGNIGILFIIGLGVATMRREMGLRKLWRVLGEGFRLGRTAAWLPYADWEYLLTRPLEEVRETLKITQPRTYFDTRAEFAELLAQPV